MRTFQPNNTLPATGGGFVEGPNVRGTLEVIWSCFPNVPGQFKETTGTGFKSWLRELGKLSYTAILKVARMLYTIVLPECVLGKALSGFMRARQQVAERKELIQNGDETAAESLQLQLKSRTATHTMLADLGGFVVDFRNLSVPTSSDDDEKTVPVRDEPENDRQIREGKVIGKQDISVSEGRRTAGESTAHKIEFTSQSPAKQNPPPSRETNSPNDEVSKRIRQDDILTQPKNTETNDSESLRNSANMEQDTLILS